MAITVSALEKSKSSETAKVEWEAKLVDAMSRRVGRSNAIKILEQPAGEVLGSQLSGLEQFRSALQQLDQQQSPEEAGYLLWKALLGEEQAVAQEGLHIQKWCFCGCGGGCCICA